MTDRVVIVAAKRTPIGAMLGSLSRLQGHQLGSIAIRAALEQAQIPADKIQEVLLGCVLPAGQGQAPARQAAINAGLPNATGATTLNKVCGSGMKAAMLAHDLIQAGSQDVVLAGGMESMSNAPYLLARARDGYRYGHGTVFDHMALDGLEDAYDKLPNGGGKSMGQFAELCASKFAFSREAQDAYAIESSRRARQANEQGYFDWEMAAVTVKTRQGETLVERDESPFKINPEKIPTLKPAFQSDGTVTAASSSSISDGAAALVLMRESTANQMGLTPIAAIAGHATHAQAPDWFTTAPVGAINKLYQKTGWSSKEVDLFEINEAFAVVAMATMREHDLPHNRVNVHGGAVALGHPIGASGARLLVTLLGALKRTGGRRGVASLCIGGGEATAVGLEMLES
ncbi:MAG: acetyl-CoA C-acyltransferase [Burkholderiaceae bacterium]